VSLCDEAKNDEMQAKVSMVFDVRLAKKVSQKDAGRSERELALLGFSQVRGWRKEQNIDQRADPLIVPFK